MLYSMLKLNNSFLKDAWLTFYAFYKQVELAQAMFVLALKASAFCSDRTQLYIECALIFVLG